MVIRGGVGMNWQGARKAITQASALYMTTPNPDEAKGGGHNNNNTIARGVEAGKILKAVYDQPDRQKCWLLFAYSEMFSNTEVKALCLYVTAKVLADYQLAYGQMREKKLQKCKVVISRAIMDFKQRVNSATKMPIKELAFGLCSADNWHRDFSRVHRMTLKCLDELDKNGLQPVSEVVKSLRQYAA